MKTLRTMHGSLVSLVLGASYALADCPDQLDPAMEVLVKRSIEDNTGRILPPGEVSRTLLDWQYFEAMIWISNAVVISLPSSIKLDAAATCVSFANVPSAGAILINEDFLRAIKFNDHGNPYPTFVLFHELAHLRQGIELGYEAVFERPRRKNIELGADFMAGFALRDLIEYQVSKNAKGYSAWNDAMRHVALYLGNVEKAIIERLGENDRLLGSSAAKVTERQQAFTRGFLLRGDRNFFDVIGCDPWYEGCDPFGKVFEISQRIYP